MQDVLLQWFRSRGWTPFGFQLRTWSAYLAGRSGLLHAPTGTGKTLAVWLGPLAEYLASQSSPRVPASPCPRIAVSESSVLSPQSWPLTVLWLTPLRALANDTAQALIAPIEALNLPWTVELRTGDTSASVRKRQRQRLPSALVTTPESLSLLLSYPETRDAMRHLRCVIVDEWHELLSTKRGAQAELALARLRAWQPGLRTWGLSATLGNLEQAMQVLLGVRGAHAGKLITLRAAKSTEIVTLQPPDFERFGWSGHIGTRLLPRVIETIAQARSTLLFTNTRAQAETWFRELMLARPDWIGQVALHHGSLDRDIREQVENMCRAGSLRCVVCTSSLDLGVDFPAVDQVIQIGSPKAAGRLLQRAGRSGHQPEALSRIVCVPTHAFELIEYAAVRQAVRQLAIEPRRPLNKPLDLLAQHVVTIAAGGGFTGPELLAEVRDAHAYRDLTDDEWQWVMDFVRHGGASLHAYPQFARVAERDGRWVVASPAIARLHRMAIGTIAGEPQVNVRLLSGGTLGTLEESFVARLHPGDCFVFAGRTVELVMVHDMTAFVRKAPKPKGPVPRWSGTRVALSAELTRHVREKLSLARQGRYADPEMRWVRPVLDLQAAWSRIPEPHELLIERTCRRGVTHLFVFPFEGRGVHASLAHLAAERLGRQRPCTINFSANDYGFALISDAPLDLDEAAWRGLLACQNLREDLQTCLNAAQLARRRFRDIARVAGLVFAGYPGQARATRHLQASAELFFDVFTEYDPGNLLLEQARREVLDTQFDFDRLAAALERIDGMQLALVETLQLTPLAFPIWAEHIHAQVTSEKWIDRVKRMSLQLETAASGKDPNRRTTRRAADPVG